MRTRKTRKWWRRRWQKRSMPYEEKENEDKEQLWNRRKSTRIRRTSIF